MSELKRSVKFTAAKNCLIISRTLCHDSRALCHDVSMLSLLHVRLHFVQCGNTRYLCFLRLQIVGFISNCWSGGSWLCKFNNISLKFSGRFANYIIVAIPFIEAVAGFGARHVDCKSVAIGIAAFHTTKSVVESPGST